MEESLIARFREQLEIECADVKTYSALTLAYIGDSVFDLLVKTYFVSPKNLHVNRYHQLTSSVVRAHAQAELIKAITPMLTEEEDAVFKRGRNAQSYTRAKNASVIDYRMATGLEALIGYLYLDGRYHRLVELMQAGFAALSVTPEEGFTETFAEKE